MLKLARPAQLAAADADPDAWPSELSAMMEADWALDHGGYHFLDRQRFALCWFQLADSFTDGISAREYGGFLQQMIDQLLYRTPSGRWRWKLGFAAQWNKANEELDDDIGSIPLELLAGHTGAVKEIRPKIIDASDLVALHTRE